MAADLFQGYRVLEVATWQFVPAAGAVLADFGADVVKVEHTDGGDPQRKMDSGGVIPKVNGVSITIEQVNRGKRSICLDIAKPEGRAVLDRLIDSSDVFMTNFLPNQRAKLGVDYEQVRARKPDIVYVRADAVGRLGPDAGRPGFDVGVFWSRSGICSAVGQPHFDPPPRSRPGFGDKTSAMNVAFGVAAALLRRARTGEGAVVDVSLLSSAVWVESSDILYSKVLGRDFSRAQLANPYYRTADDRWIQVHRPANEAAWQALYRQIGRDDLLADERFSTPAGRAANGALVEDELRVVFRSADLATWRKRFADYKGAWEPVNDLVEVTQDPQVLANGYLTEMDHPDAGPIPLVRAPVHFDETLTELRPAPRAGQHSRQLLAEVGVPADEIDALVGAGVVVEG